MSLFTPNRNYPYPQTSDAPNVPGDMLSLATAIDSDMASQVAAISAVTASVNGLHVGGRGAYYPKSGTVQAVTANVATKYSFDGTPTTSSMWTASGTGNTDFVCNGTGWALICAGFRFQWAPSSLANVYTVIRKGTTELHGNNFYANTGGANAFPVDSITMLAPVTTGDSFNVMTLPTLGISIQQAGQDISLSLFYLGL